MKDVSKLVEYLLNPERANVPATFQLIVVMAIITSQGGSGIILYLRVVNWGG